MLLANAAAAAAAAAGSINRRDGPAFTTKADAPAAALAAVRSQGAPIDGGLQRRPQLARARRKRQIADEEPRRRKRTRGARLPPGALGARGAIAPGGGDRYSSSSAAYLAAAAAADIRFGGAFAAISQLALGQQDIRLGARRHVAFFA